MPSQAQIEANRRNALKSTGPRTTEGKAAISRNALKHGFAALLTPPAPEAGQEITRLAREYCRQLRPDGPRETLRVRELAVAAWRLSQLPDLEAALCSKCNLSNGFRILNTLARYQHHVERSFYRAAAELEHLRKEQSQFEVGEMAQR